jgi:hypothetical protein
MRARERCFLGMLAITASTDVVLSPWMSAAAKTVIDVCRTRVSVAFLACWEAMSWGTAFYKQHIDEVKI